MEKVKASEITDLRNMLIETIFRNMELFFYEELHPVRKEDLLKQIRRDREFLNILNQLQKENHLINPPEFE